MNKDCSRLSLVLILVMGLSLASLNCGSSNSAQSPVTPSLTLSPRTVAVASNGTYQFTAQVTGLSDTGVQWAVNGVAGGSPSTGTVSSSGLYTAPGISTPASFTIQASSTDGSMMLSSTVTVMVPGSVVTTNNPQVAKYSILAPDGSNVQVDFGTDTTYGRRTWSVPAPSGGGMVNVLVAGMLASMSYHMQAAVTLSDTAVFADADHVFTTGALPADKLPTITATTTAGMTPSSGVELLDLVDSLGVGGSESAVTTAATDLNGNVIWSYDTGSTNIPQPVKLLPDGNMLINYDTPGQDGLNSVLEEVDLAGDLVWRMTAADLNQALAAAGYNLTVVGTHHDVAILPNGHLIVIASEVRNFDNLVGYPPTDVTGDVLIDLDTNRVPVWTWSTFDHLDVNRHPFQFPDWTHTNAVLYSPDDGDLVISIRHQGWIIKIDYQNGTGSGDIVWTLGWQGSLTLVGGTDPSDWFYAQHGPYFATSNTSGTFQLGLFDNSDNGYNVGSSTPCGVLSTSPCQSRVQIYEIDETAKTATIVWQDPLSVFSFFGGNADGLANGDVEFDECATGIAPNAAVYEVTQTSSPQVVWQMQISGQYAYRAFRIPSLYPGIQW